MMFTTNYLIEGFIASSRYSFLITRSCIYFLHTLYSFSTLNKIGEPSLWVMNLGPDAIEKRTEVQFYDRFDLIGEGNHTDTSSEGAYTSYAVDSVCGKMTYPVTTPCT
jgi:hypothetical protein